MEDLLKIKVRSNGEEQLIELFGDKGFVSNRNQFQLGGLNFSLSYGSKPLPNTFFYWLERFPAWSVIQVQIAQPLLLVR